MKKTLTITVWAAALTLAFAPVMTHADMDNPGSKVGFRGWGPRAGVTFGPDQALFGAHMDFGNFADHIRFQPNVDIGFSDGFTLFSANADAAYRFASNWDVWSPYLGGGIGAHHVSANNGGGNGSSTKFGASILGGIEKGLANGHRFFVEAKLGLADSPDMKAIVGWTFYH
jgi:opacity protein-like surface antigen